MEETMFVGLDSLEVSCFMPLNQQTIIVPVQAQTSDRVPS